jgi:hypothetical protein
MRLRHVLISASVVAAAVATAGGTVSAAPTKVGTETFTSVQDINTPGGPVTASGVINATGTDIVISDTQDTFDFGAHGSITVFHSPVRSVNHFSEKKCSGRFTEHGTYVFGNGTGEWANFNGSGKYTASGTITDACTGPGTGTLTIVAFGPINNSTNG